MEDEEEEGKLRRLKGEEEMGGGGEGRVRKDGEEKGKKIGIRRWNKSGKMK